MSTFDFGTAATFGEAYTPPLADRLPKGNYIGRITELENAASRNGDPMLKLKLENEQGVQWDNLVVIAGNDYVELMFSKVLALLDAAGLPRPVPGTDIDTQTGRLSDEYTNKLLGRQVGFLVRDEPDNRPDHAGESQPKVNGRYVKPEVLKGKTGATGAPSGVASVTNGKANTDDDIPFLREHDRFECDLFHAHENR